MKIKQLNIFVRMNYRFLLFLLMPFLLLNIACDRSDTDPVGDELARLEAWIYVNNIDPNTKKPSGLYFINKQEGTGLTPKDSNFVIISFTAKTLDDVVFQTTYKEVAELNDIFQPKIHYVPQFKQYLTNNFNIKALPEGLSYMKEGGSARLIIPSNLGFGKTNSTLVPGYSTLIYDIALVKVVEKPKEYEQSLLTDYLATNTGFTSISDSIYIKKIAEGTRECVIAKDSVVKVMYTGRYLDGFVFDTNVESVAKENNIYSSSSDKYEPFSFTVGSAGAIAGFSVAVKKMIEGEKAIVVIPSTYAYGATGSGDIPPYTTLVFEIEIVNVEPKDIR
ncbi:MAG: FKBP-type peptidyl-prolyl cis-trans isomerase [Tenuifilaceae bacterium]